MKDMFKSRSGKKIALLMLIVFSVVFYFGVFGNPNFNIYDFSMNLASEVVGIVIALVLVESYIKEVENRKK